MVINPLVVELFQSKPNLKQEPNRYLNAGKVSRSLTSLHEGVEQRCVDEEEQVGTEL